MAGILAQNVVLKIGKEDADGVFDRRNDPVAEENQQLGRQTKRMTNSSSPLRLFQVLRSITLPNATFTLTDVHWIVKTFRGGMRIRTRAGLRVQRSTSLSRLRG